MKIRALIVATFVLALSGTLSRAQLLVPFLQSSNFVFGGNLLNANISFQQWDPAVRGGPLTNVSFTISNAAVSGAFYVLNGQSTNITLSNPRTQQIFSFAGGGAPASIFNSAQSLTNVLYTMPGGVLEPAEDGFVILNSPQPISLNSYTTNFTDPGFLSYFTGTGTVSLSIISSFNLSGIGSINNLDKGGLTTAGTVTLEMIPEPSTYALLGLSALSLGYFAWRRRRARLSTYLFNITNSAKSPVTSGFVAAFFAFVATASSQVIVSNSLVTYTYEQSAGDAFVPSSPLASATVTDSTLSFFPAGFSALNSGSAWNIDTFSSVLTVNMKANSGLWFGENAFQLTSQVNYSLNAPTSTSTAGISFTAPFTLYITEVDNAPFVSPSLQLTDSLNVTPPFIETTGPASFPTGSLSGDISLSLTTIKAHFGIGAGSNITGMRVQFSPVVSAWSERGSASASLVNVDIANAVVPEPSTYALLLLGAAATGLMVWRRRRA